MIPRKRCDIRCLRRQRENFSKSTILGFPSIVKNVLDWGLRFIVPFASSVHEIADEDSHFRTKDFVYEQPIALHIEIGIKLTEFEHYASSFVGILIDQLRISNQEYSIRTC